jgi:muconate cycloisomerase
MKIRRIIIDEVVVRAKPDSVNSPEVDKPLHMLPHGGRAAWSVQFDKIPKLIVRLEMQCGIVGLGEFYRGVPVHAVSDIARGLLGLDLKGLNFQALSLPAGRLYDGFESAILDAIGKQSGLSISELLGGRYRDRVYCGYWTGHRTVAEAARKAAEGKAKGFDCIKFKCDSTDPVVEWCQAIREACGPAFKVILDPNQRFENIPTARRLANELAAVGNVLCLEDPIARWDLESLALLRKLSPLPLALHLALPYNEMGYQHPSDIIRALRLDACDYFNFNGGIFPVKRLATIAELARKPFWHGSEVDLGILEAAYVHKCAASEGATLPSDIFGELVRENDLILKPLRFDGAYVSVPEGPGLGVELDVEAVKHYRTNTWTLQI